MALYLPWSHLCLLSVLPSPSRVDRAVSDWPPADTARPLWLALARDLPAVCHIFAEPLGPLLLQPLGQGSDRLSRACWTMGLRPSPTPGRPRVPGKGALIVQSDHIWACVSGVLIRQGGSSCLSSRDGEVLACWLGWPACLLWPVGAGILALSCCTSRRPRACRLSTVLWPLSVPVVLSQHTGPKEAEPNPEPSSSSGCCPQSLQSKEARP